MKTSDPHVYGKHALLLLFLIVGLVLPAIFLFPFQSDIDNYQCMGFKLYQTHGLPYVDSFVANFPGMPLLHEFVIAWFGNTVFGFRSFELLWQAVTLFVLFGVIRLWVSEASALLACLLFALYYVFGPAQFLGQPDGFAVLPLVLAIFFMIAAYRDVQTYYRNSFLIIAGALYASATVIRPTYALMLFFPMFLLFDLRRGSLRSSYVFASLGFLAIMVMVMLPLAVIQPGLREAYLDTIRYNFDVYGPAFNLHNASDRAWIVLALLMGWGAIMLVHRSRERRFREVPQVPAERRFLIATFAALLFGIIFQRRFAGYHFIPFFAFFMPVVAALFWEWKSRLGRRGTVMLWAMLTGSIVLFYPWHRLVTLLTVKTSARPFSERWYADSDTYDMVSYVMQHTNPKDTVGVSSASSDQWRIDRTSATRFATTECLTTTRPDGTVLEYQQQWRAEYVNGLRHSKYYVVQNLIDPAGRFSELDILFRIPGLKVLLSDHFILDTTFGRYWVYKRK
jgi:hypothetical protein